MGMGRTDGGECAPLASEDSARPAETAEPQETAVETAEPSRPPTPSCLSTFSRGTNMDGVGPGQGFHPPCRWPLLTFLSSGRVVGHGRTTPSHMGVQYFGPEVTFGHRLLELIQSSRWP